MNVLFVEANRKKQFQELLRDFARDGYLPISHDVAIIPNQNRIPGSPLAVYSAILVRETLSEKIGRRIREKGEPEEESAVDRRDRAEYERGSL